MQEPIPFVPTIEKPLDVPPHEESGLVSLDPNPFLPTPEQPIDSDRPIVPYALT